jgi:5'-3' exonuclease
MAESIKTLRFNPDEPVVLIDTSYYIFYRYFATLRWYAFQPTFVKSDATGEGGSATYCDDPVFMAAYYKHWTADIAKFRKKLAGKNSTVVYLLDCPQETIWRNAFHQGYKGGRKLSASLDTRIFQKTYQWLGESAAASQMVRSAYLEADDLAYLVAKALRAVVPEVRLVFLTNDNDYLQLCDERAICVNAALKNLQSRCVYGGQAAVEKRAKILLGDSSDAIPACFRKKDPLVPSLLEMPEAELIACLQKTSLKAYEQYVRNRLLIDMDYIPEEHQARFQSEWRVKANGGEKMI